MRVDASTGALKNCSCAAREHSIEPSFVPMGMGTGGSSTASSGISPNTFCQRWVHHKTQFFYTAPNFTGRKYNMCIFYKKNAGAFRWNSTTNRKLTFFYIQNYANCIVTNWFKPRTLLRGECRRCFVDIDRQLLHRSSVCPWKDQIRRVFQFLPD